MVHHRHRCWPDRGPTINWMEIHSAFSGVLLDARPLVSVHCVVHCDCISILPYKHLLPATATFSQRILIHFRWRRCGRLTEYDVRSPNERSNSTSSTDNSSLSISLVWFVQWIAFHSIKSMRCVFGFELVRRWFIAWQKQTLRTLHSRHKPQNPREILLLSFCIQTKTDFVSLFLPSLLAMGIDCAEQIKMEHFVSDTVGLSGASTRPFADQQPTHRY